jgi:YVTN family beta-propeller protein
LAVSPDGAHVYATDYNAGNVSVISTASNTVTSTIAAGSGANAVALQFFGGLMYVANYNANTVSVITPFDGKVVETVTVGEAPAALAVGCGNVYVANSGSNTISVINPFGGSVATLNVGNDPVAVATQPVNW